MRDLDLADGRALATVEVERLHGASHVWVEHVGDDDDEPGACAIGLSSWIVVENPTIANMQRTNDHESSPIERDFVQVNHKGRDVVVTAVTNDGFYATDKTKVEWCGPLVFTHSRPRGVEPGARMVSLSGRSEAFFV